ncbi:MbtH family protein [Streptomyces sp. NPDC007095]|uniref:MbtH family protein n=1 Tax=Streptomyces sp. NPDC007095 TaxID=3154482 RepID=UPI000C704D64
MPNPFENDGASHFVLVHDESQHSLWPAFAEIPAGWKAVHGEDTRAACLEYVEQHRIPGPGPFRIGLRVAGRPRAPRE